MRSELGNRFGRLLPHLFMRKPEIGRHTVVHDQLIPLRFRDGSQSELRVSWRSDLLDDDEMIDVCTDIARYGRRDGHSALWQGKHRPAAVVVGRKSLKQLLAQLPPCLGISSSGCDHAAFTEIFRSDSIAAFDFGRWIVRTPCENWASILSRSTLSGIRIVLWKLPQRRSLR